MIYDEFILAPIENVTFTQTGTGTFTATPRIPEDEAWEILIANLFHNDGAGSRYCNMRWISQGGVYEIVAGGSVASGSGVYFNPTRFFVATNKSFLESRISNATAGVTLTMNLLIRRHLAPYRRIK